MKKKCAAVIGMVFCCMMMMSTIAWAADDYRSLGIPILYFHGVGGPGQHITLYALDPFRSIGGSKLVSVAPPVLLVAIVPGWGSFAKGTKLVARLKFGTGPKDTRDIEVVSNGELEQHFDFWAEVYKH